MFFHRNKDSQSWYCCTWTLDLADGGSPLSHWWCGNIPISKRGLTWSKWWWIGVRNVSRNSRLGGKASLVRQMLVNTSVVHNPLVCVHKSLTLLFTCDFNNLPSGLASCFCKGLKANILGFVGSMGSVKTMPFRPLWDLSSHQQAHGWESRAVLHSDRAPHLTCSLLIPDLFYRIRKVKENTWTGPHVLYELNTGRSTCREKC